MAISAPSTSEFVVDQELRQIQNVQALQPINGPQIVGVDASKTPPQVTSMISPMDGELPRPATIGNDFYRKAREIRRDPTIRMVRELTVAPLLMAEWEFEATNRAPQGAKELVAEQMTKMRLALLRTSLLGCCDYGWQPYEVIAEQNSDGSSGVRLKPLLQDITSILVNAADGSFFGLRQTPMIGLRIGWIYLLDQECFVVSQDVEGTNWYGEPTLRSVEKTYDENEMIAKQSRKYDAKIAGTHWVIYYPLGTSNYGGSVVDNGEIAKMLLQQAEAVGGICVPRSVVNTLDSMNAALAQSEASQWKIELLSDAGKGQTPFTDRQKYLDVLKVRAFGWPERAILEGQFGTKAEAGVHADVGVSNLEMKHALFCKQYDLKLVNTILRWNWGPDAQDTVFVKPSPLADDTKMFFRQIYLTMLANPQGFMTEMGQLNLQQLHEKLGLPVIEHQTWDQVSDPYAMLIGDEQQQQQQLPQNQDFGTQPQETTPIPLTFSRDVETAANETDTTASKSQRKAGNFRKGKIRFHGLTVSVETPRGERRKPEWPKLPAHYGYINRTEGKDGDHVDCFVGKHPDSEVVFVIDQLNKQGGFDEHKVMIGYKNKRKAIEAYKAAYDRNWRVGQVTTLTMGQFKDWLQDGDMTQPISEQQRMVMA